ncbi:hypothetical protein C0995_016618 [Termitomyces sp. Mi166|nr:hypothetical protein C0995_016618 [Termitomyces sp. Mi166\
MSANASPSSSNTLAKLTSISTLTLSLLLERQRPQNLPSFSSSPNPSPSPFPSASSSSTPTPAAQGLHLAQITKNLARLREGILELERKEGERTEATRLLRTQYERMRGMLGGEGGAESLQDEEQEIGAKEVIAPQPTVPVQAKVLAEPHVSVYTPYTDEEPVAGVDADGEEDENGILLQQRRMMNEQDAHLDRLSHSITRQHHISLQINDELDVHRGLLEELDTDLERTEGRLGRARRGLERVGRGVKGNIGLS